MKYGSNQLIRKEVICNFKKNAYFSQFLQGHRVKVKVIGSHVGIKLKVMSQGIYI